MNALKDKKILVIGANGFIGGHLCHRLFSLSYNVKTLDLCSSNYIGDISDKKFVLDSLQDFNPEYIFHLAAFKERTATMDSFYDAIKVNLIGTLNILSSAKNLSGLKKIVVMGTAEEYGFNSTPFSEMLRENPVTAYSFSKVCSSHLCSLINSIYDLPVLVLRPSIAYGPGQNIDMFIPSLIKNILLDKTFDMTSGEQTRDFIYVDDLVTAMLKAVANNMLNSGIINIGSGEPVKIRDLALKIENMLNKSSLIMLGARDYRKLEIMEYFLDNSKAKKVLNWQPLVSLEEGLKKTIEYYKR
ncbi:MAG: NAD(P)-dependent oxidoreductase [bacterium]